MKFITKYTFKNIKANKLRAILLICCIAFASVLFFVSLVFPLYLENYWEGTMRSYFGNSDIYMESTGGLGNLNDIPESMKENFEYSYGFLAYPSVRFSLQTKQDEAITYIAGNFADVQAFNPVRILSGDATGFDDPDSRKAIITQSTASKFGWNVGDTVRVVVLGQGDNFKIAAIVASEGLLSEKNEATGPIMLLSRAGVREAIKGIISNDSADDSDLDAYFTMAVFKVKDGVNIPGIASELANIFEGFDVSETVNNQILSQAVSYLRTPFIACIYLVCAFCALIIYLTCKLTFSERVRQFAVLKSMGASTFSLFFSLLLESSFYGLIGGSISIIFALLQVYCLPLIAKQMTYITPVSASYYLWAVFFGVVIAVASSFVQALKSTRKSIKQTMLYKEKFTTQKIWVSVSSSIIFFLGAGLMIFTYKTLFKPLSILLFLVTLASLIFALPFFISKIFTFFKLIFKKRTFDSLYLKNTLPSKNLSVANRLLFFGMFLVFLCSTLISSLSNLAIEGQKYDYDILISQASATTITPDNFEEIKNVEGVDYAWQGIIIENALISQTNKYLGDLVGLSKDDIIKLYSGDVKSDILNSLTTGQILLNKYYRDAKGFRVGDLFSVNVGTKTTQTIEFEICGFIDNYDDWGDVGICIIDDLQKVENIDKFNTIFVKVESGASVEEVISSIRKLPFIGQGENEAQQATAQFLTFTNIEKQSEIFVDQISAPLLILRTYSVMVLILSLLCIFIGYVLYLRESSEYHKTLFSLGMSPNKFQLLIVKQSILTTFLSIIMAVAMSALLYFNFENIFNALGTSFTTKVNYFEFSMYAVGMLVGTTIMAYGLGEYFKRDLTRSDKRLFG